MDRKKTIVGKWKNEDANNFVYIIVKIGTGEMTPHEMEHQLKELVVPLNQRMSLVSYQITKYLLETNLSIKEKLGDIKGLLLTDVNSKYLYANEIIGSRLHDGDVITVEGIILKNGEMLAPNRQK